MGSLTSRQNAGVEEVDIVSNHAYKYPPRSGQYGKSVMTFAFTIYLICLHSNNIFFLRLIDIKLQTQRFFSEQSFTTIKIIKVIIVFVFLPVNKFYYFTIQQRR